MHWEHSDDLSRLQDVLDPHLARILARQFRVTDIMRSTSSCLCVRYTRKVEITCAGHAALDDPGVPHLRLRGFVGAQTRKLFVRLLGVIVAQMRSSFGGCVRYERYLTAGCRAPMVCRISIGALTAGM